MAVVLDATPAKPYLRVLVKIDTPELVSQSLDAEQRFCKQ
jgi:hypothetical protein